MYKTCWPTARRLWILTLVTGAGLLHARAAAAQTGVLQPGDVTMTCVDTAGGPLEDLIQVTNLIPLPATVDPYVISYTDREADSNGVFETGSESATPFTRSGARPAGVSTTFMVSGLTGPNEQVFLFQGSLSNTTGILTAGALLWGFQMTTPGGWASSRTDGISALPSALAGANVGLTTGSNTKFAYTGPLSGTRAQLQAAIADPNNWTGGADCPTGLTVTDPDDLTVEGPPEAAVEPTDGGDGRDGGDSADVGEVQGTGGTVGTAGLGGAGGAADAGADAAAAGGAGGVVSGVGGNAAGGASGTGGSGGAGPGGTTGTGGGTGLADAGPADAGPADTGPADAGTGGAGGIISGGAGVGGIDGGDDASDAALDGGQIYATRSMGCGCALTATDRDFSSGLAVLIAMLGLARLRRRRS